jgi:hypothetical protein
MSYGEKKRRQKFIVKFEINYPSGKKWKEQTEVEVYSEIGAEDTIRWLKSGKDISILSIKSTGEYIGKPIYPDNHCVGDR